ncbi:MAG: TonB-dependent receptor [Bacteroidota bacterium]
MKLSLFQTTIATFILFFSVSGFSQEVTLHGYVKDGDNGEALIGANIFVKGTATGTVTNVYGFYSLTLKPDNYTIVYSYVGYEEKEITFDLTRDVQQTIELQPAKTALDEVIVTAEKQNSNVTNTKIGIDKLDAKTIEQIPAMMGEVDVIKSLQLLPGVVPTGEISSGMSIRGGGRDQNLVLLDEGTVYNASHALGLFSVFNNDAIKNVELYKGIIPSQYGGRLSSLIDIRMKDGNSKNFSGKGSIGLITSKLTLEAPIIKDKSSIMLSGRRTYLDLLTKAAHKMFPKEVPGELPVYFYDFNAKVNYSINSNNRLYLSGYFGRDNADFSVDDENIFRPGWGNYTGTLRWNHIVNKKLFTNITLITSQYDYDIYNKFAWEEDEETKYTEFNWTAQLRDQALKADFGYFLNPNNTIRFGMSSIYHEFDLARIKGKTDTVDFNFHFPQKYSLESAFYVGNEQKHGKFALEYGLRLSVLNNIGKTDEYTLKNYEVVDTTSYRKGEFYNTEWGLEPRISVNYTVNDKNSVKAGYARTRQYLHIASSSESGTPLDVWMPSGPNVNPQIADQVTIGFYKNMFDDYLQLSFETYYKWMQNTIEFKDFAQPYLNPSIESDFRFGRGRAYGLEFLGRVPRGKFSGWVSYTLSRSERKIRDIQEKNWYLSPFDVTHNLSVVGQFEVTKRLFLSSNYVLMSGRPFNVPSARWNYYGWILPYYDGKNTSRYPNYRRLDLGIELKNKPKKRYESSWVFSVYNVLNTKNANLIYFEQEYNSQVTQAYRQSLLGRIYSVSFNFKF